MNSGGLTAHIKRGSTMIFSAFFFYFHPYLQPVKNDNTN